MEMINMINKNKIIRVFIILFIVNAFYLLFCKSYAASVTVTPSSVQLNVGETKTLMVTVQPPSLGTNVTLGNLQKRTYDRSTGEDLTRRSRTDTCY